MQIKNVFKNSLFARSFSLAKSNPSKIGLIVLFDISFLVSFYYVLPILARYFASNIAVSETASFLIIFNIFSLLHLFLILFVYSFFKYCVLDSIKSMFAKADSSFNRLWQFYLLNVILLLPAYILFSAVIGGVKEAYRPYALIVLGTPVSLFLYALINLSHSFFYQGSSIKESIKRSLKITFTKLKVYRETILVIIIGALVLGLLFFGIGKIISIIASRNYMLYLNIYGYFKQTSIIALDLIFYLIILMNRISFYAIAKEST